MGKAFKFVHCADLHLGSRFKGLDAVDPAMAERMRRSIFDSFKRIVDLAIEKQADALIISGDIYDEKNELPSTRMWLAEQLGRLSIPVFICRGNHDSETSWDQSIPYPDNVREFGPDIERVAIGDDVEVLGVSYAVPHETRNLAAMAEGTSGKFTIFCGHCDLESVTEGHPYAPCSMSDLQGRGVDYWAFGHIHKRAEVSTDPYVVYPGNIQGRNFKETGKKGAYLVTVDSGRVASFEFIPTQTYIWEDLTVDISGKSFSDIVSDLTGKLGKDSICRMTFVGSGQLDTMLRNNPDDIRKTIASSTGCTISGIRVATSPEVDLDARRDDMSMPAAVVRTGRAFAAKSKDEIIDLICSNKVAAKYRDHFSEMTEDELRTIVEDSTKMILARMEVPR